MALSDKIYEINGVQKQNLNINGLDATVFQK